MAIRQSINTLLRGYLDLLQLRTGGANPQVVSDFVQPTMDLQRWYLESRVSTHAGGATPFVANTNAGLIPIAVTNPPLPIVGGNLTVPTNETWIIWPGTRISVSFSANAGQEGQGDLVATTPHPLWLPMAPLAGWTTSAAAPIRGNTRTLAEPVWLPPGSILSGYQYGLTVPAGTISVDVSVRLVRLRI